MTGLCKPLHSSNGCGRPGLINLAPRSVDTVVLAKAGAMVLMVANHSRLSQALLDVPALYGGLNAMLTISGLTMATHAFQHDTRRTLRVFARFALRLALPCLTVALVWDSLLLVLGARAITPFRYFAELALFSNWLSTHKLALFPIWYVQAVVQMLLGLRLLFLLTDLTPHIRLPHLLVWNFILGWLIWARQHHGRASRGRKLVLSAVLLGATTMAYPQPRPVSGLVDERNPAAGSMAATRDIAWPAGSGRSSDFPGRVHDFPLAFLCFRSGRGTTEVPWLRSPGPAGTAQAGGRTHLASAVLGLVHRHHTGTAQVGDPAALDLNRPTQASRAGWTSRSGDC